tara:strand:+ start:67 stop:531 length:465 start_codon:yes stop_codon:yes gene_type:complete
MPTPKKPKALKVLTGTFKQSRELENEMEIAPLKKIPNPPEDFAGIALSTWIKTARILHESGVLTEGDLYALEGFCRIREQLLEAESELRSEGLVIHTAVGTTVKNPLCTIVNECRSQFIKFSAVLGLDPASRTKIQGPKKEKRKTGFSSLKNVK